MLDEWIRAPVVVALWIEAPHATGAMDRAEIEVLVDPIEVEIVPASGAVLSVQSALLRLGHPLEVHKALCQ